MSIDELSRDDFARHVGSEARLVASPGVSLTIAEVSPSRRSGEWEAFSVLLRGPAEVALGQGSYGLELDGLGDLTLFFVPIEPDAQGARYEAVFNRACAQTGGTP